MNILGIARQQLCDAISNFQTPNCDPLKVSPWIAMVARETNERKSPRSPFASRNMKTSGPGIAAMAPRISPKNSNVMPVGKAKRD